MTEIGPSIVEAFDHVWGRFTTRLQGLVDNEYFWEPVHDCWSLRRGADHRWALDGTDGRQAPNPAPITTIAWRIGHVGLALGGFAHRCFAGSPAPNDGLPANAASAVEYLGRNYGRWRAGIAALPDPAWSRELGPGWEPFASATTTDLSLHVLDELVHHAAEISLLRDLYAHRGAE